MAEFSDPVSLRLASGPRDDLFGPRGLEQLCGQEWLVGAESNRVGLRLTLAPGSAPLERVRAGESQIEGILTWALQVPPAGQPVLFLADHPVTGGYPVIGVHVQQDVWAAAQLAAGTRVRFTISDESTPVVR